MVPPLGLSGPILEQVQLISEVREFDLLLPKERSDVRFRSVISRQQGTAYDPSILRFIEQSKLDLWGNQRIQTPSKLKLSLPTAVLPYDVRQKQDLLGVVEVEYSFVSLEHCVTLPAKDKSGFRMYYTTIEGGQMGGRRNEVILDTTPFEVVPTDEDVFQKGLPLLPMSTIENSGMQNPSNSPMTELTTSTPESMPFVDGSLSSTTESKPRGTESSVKTSNAATSREAFAYELMPLITATMEFVRGLGAMDKQAKDEEHSKLTSGSDVQSPEVSLASAKDDRYAGRKA